MEPLDVAVLALRFGMVLLLYAFILGVLRAARTSLRAAEVEPVRTAARAVASESPSQRSTGPGVLILRVVEPGGSGLQPGETFQLHGEAIVGRAATADVQVPDSTVSNRHARFQPRSDGWTFQDLGSTNGSQVDGATASGPVNLRPGAQVALGRVVLVVDSHDKA
ncbi:MAG: FHA domain-containing protein [Chloroflexi bacterium]|nr:FHA domain-containing protein [Chloroflexota bacterium]